MSINSSSSSLPPPPLLSSIKPFSIFQTCFNSTTGIFNLVSFNVTSVVLVLPLCVLVFYLGCQRWRHSGSTSTHSDVFTYHMVVVELFSIFGGTLIYWGVFADLPLMTASGFFVLSLNVSGQINFHLLTCVDRYLAVVYPVTYMSLRKARGVRIRNVTIGCVWLLSFSMISLLSIKDSFNIIIYCFGAIYTIIITYCSLSVLCVLIRPGPGEGGGARQRVDQSKLRAFYTIMAILGALLFNCVGVVLFTKAETEKCRFLFTVPWFSLPSSLVLPLLFLHRAGKLECGRKKKKSDTGSEQATE